ncbi:MAG TPA: leucyl aminopeptidase [Steroidobacteraceae bacterium]|nr:leucyl aminopeptidase [Steroidobacteraceae bacterium]
MQFSAYSGKALDQRTDCLVIGAFEARELGREARAVDRAVGGRLKSLLGRGDFAGRAGESLLLTEWPGLRGSRLLLVGLGTAATYQRRNWKRALATAMSALARTRIRSANFAIERPADQSLDDYILARSSSETCGNANYRINDLKTGKRPPPPALARVQVGPFPAARLADARRGLADGAAISASAAVLRNLANLPANVCTPRYLAAQAAQLARTHGSVRARALNEAQIRRLKMGCLLAVTRGSAEPPRFIILEHRGGRRGAAPLVLVGKGITFDTGGISLKDANAMDEMKFDMCGAATVLAAVDLAARLKLRLNVVGLVATCENMPGGRAIKPGDIVTSAAGQTVEILNTDAEGRLILCDALNYARRFQPAAVIDIATLTGACVVALGAHHSGIMGNDDKLAQELVTAGLRADDRAWQLPLTAEYGEQLKTNFADVANVAGREGGAITAAAFLSRFTKDLKWAHMDIAGTAWLSGTAKSATGRPLGLLADFLIQRARA